MHIRGKSFDDLLMEVLKKLIKGKVQYSSSRGDIFGELDGVLLELSNPCARLSRTEGKGTVFSSLGELLWYLAGSNDLDFISYYIPHYVKDSEDGKTIYGGYGPRLFGENCNQIDNVMTLLRNKIHSRKAVIQIFDAEDISEPRNEVPCTCTLQFIIRNNLLHMITYMRSNDSFLGFSHDFFAFTMLQEIMARSLNVGLGKYKHVVGSLHLYVEHVEKAQMYLNEGWQDNISMPSMPDGDPWPSIKKLLKAEKKIRSGEEFDVNSLGLDQYWCDLVRLLKIYRYLKDNELKKVIEIKNNMSSSVYETYIRRKLATKMMQFELAG